MQGLLTKAALGTATRAAVSSAGRAGSTAAFRTSAQKPVHGKSGLSHTARSFQTPAAATEAPPAPVVTVAPSL